MRLTRWLVGVGLMLPGVFAGGASADPWSTRPDPEVVYRISAEAFGLGASNDDTVLVFRGAGADGEVFWAAERWQAKKDVGEPLLERHVWLDGRKCPALEAALEGLARLPPARIGPPTSTDDDFLEFDGGDVVVSGPGPGPSGSDRSAYGAEGRRGRVVRLAEHSGPVSDWWSKAKSTLDPCWQTSPALSDGTVLKTRMVDGEGAKAQKP